MPHVPEMKERVLATSTIRSSGGRVGLIDLGGINVPLETCAESDLECIRLQIQSWKDSTVKERAYKVVVRQVNELWDAKVSDEIDINDLHFRTGHPEEAILRKVGDSMRVRLKGER